MVLLLRENGQTRSMGVRGMTMTRGVALRCLLFDAAAVLVRPGGEVCRAGGCGCEGDEEGIAGAHHLVLETWKQINE